MDKLEADNSKIAVLWFMMSHGFVITNNPDGRNLSKKTVRNTMRHCEAKQNQAQNRRFCCSLLVAALAFFFLPCISFEIWFPDYFLYLKGKIAL